MAMNCQEKSGLYKDVVTSRVLTAAASFKPTLSGMNTTMTEEHRQHQLISDALSVLPQM